MNDEEPDMRPSYPVTVIMLIGLWLDLDTDRVLEWGARRTLKRGRSARRRRSLSSP